MVKHVYPIQQSEQGAMWPDSIIQGQCVISLAHSIFDMLTDGQLIGISEHSEMRS